MYQTTLWVAKCHILACPRISSMNPSRIFFAAIEPASLRGGPFRPLKSKAGAAYFGV